MWLQCNEAKHNKTSHNSLFPIKMINALFTTLLYVQVIFSLIHKSTFHKEEVVILKYLYTVNIYILLVLPPGSYGSMIFSEI